MAKDQSERRAVVIGGFDYTHHKGWFASAKGNVSVSGSAEQEGTMQAGFSRPKDDWHSEIGAYEYTRGSCYATGHLVPGISNKNDFSELFVDAIVWADAVSLLKIISVSGKWSDYYISTVTGPLTKGAQCE